jgi:hypothetical protein
MVGKDCNTLALVVTHVTTHIVLSWIVLAVCGITQPLILPKPNFQAICIMNKPYKKMYFFVSIR